MRVLVAPSIWAGDQAALCDEVSRIEDSGADRIHVDIMDGVFVPSLSFGWKTVTAIRSRTHLPLDVHLMVQNPELSIAQYVGAGASSVTVHPEGFRSREQLLNCVSSCEVTVGLALKPSTQVSEVAPMLPHVDLVLTMMVEPGLLTSQTYQPEQLGKILTLFKLREKYDLDFGIWCDGGIGLNNSHELIHAGADLLVVGTSFFDTADQRGVVTSLKMPRISQ